MEKFREIPFKCLPVDAQMQLADYLDQDCTEDYIVFHQKLEHIYGLSGSIYINLHRLRAYKSRGVSATMVLFSKYVRNNTVTLDRVYQVLQDMQLDATEVLEQFYDEIIQRWEHCRLACTCVSSPRPCQHSCRCDVCRPLESTGSSLQDYIDRHRCITPQHRSDGHFVTSQSNVPPNPNNPSRQPQCTCPLGANVRNQPNFSGQTPNTNGTSVQLPFQISSEFRTPGRETGAIPKQNIRMTQLLSRSDESNSPLQRQYQMDMRRPSQAQAPDQNDPVFLTANGFSCDITGGRPLPQHAQNNIKRRLSEDTSTYNNNHTSRNINNNEIAWIPPDDSSEEDDTEETRLVDCHPQCTCYPPDQRTNMHPQNCDGRPSSYPPKLYSPVTEQVMRKSSSEEICSGQNLNNLDCPPQPAHKKKRILLTFADDSERHMNQVLDLGNSLKRIGFDVKCDMFEQTINMMIGKRNSEFFQGNNSLVQCFSNSNEWLEFQFQNADYIIFCISPKYSLYVKPEENGNGGRSPGAHPDNCHLHAKFIYNQAIGQHIQNQTQNKRFFPVLFQNSGAVASHIPSIFQSTLIFVYPDSQNRLQEFLRTYHLDRC